MSESPGDCGRSGFFRGPIEAGILVWGIAGPPVVLALRSGPYRRSSVFPAQSLAPGSVFAGPLRLALGAAAPLDRPQFPGHARHLRTARVSDRFGPIGLHAVGRDQRGVPVRPPFRWRHGAQAQGQFSVQTWGREPCRRRRPLTGVSHPVDSAATLDRVWSPGACGSRGSAPPSRAGRRQKERPSVR